MMTKLKMAAILNKVQLFPIVKFTLCTGRFHMIKKQNILSVHLLSFETHFEKGCTSWKHLNIT